MTSLTRTGFIQERKIALIVIHDSHMNDRKESCCWNNL